MARPRRQYTLSPDVAAMVKAHADRYHNGNESAAAEALLRAGRQAQRQETIKGMAYAAVATAAIFIFLVL